MTLPLPDPDLARITAWRAPIGPDGMVDWSRGGPGPGACASAQYPRDPRPSALFHFRDYGAALGDDAPSAPAPSCAGPRAVDRFADWGPSPLRGDFTFTVSD